MWTQTGFGAESFIQVKCHEDARNRQRAALAAAEEAGMGSHQPLSLPNPLDRLSWPPGGLRTRRGPYFPAVVMGPVWRPQSPAVTPASPMSLPRRSGALSAHPRARMKVSSPIPTARPASGSSAPSPTPGSSRNTSTARPAHP